MSLLMLQLSMCVVIAIQITSSQSASDDSGCCERIGNMLSELRTINAELRETVSQYQKEYAELSADCKKTASAGELKLEKNNY